MLAATRRARGLAVSLVLVAIITIVFPAGLVTAHIIGPGIVAPSDSGFVFKESEDDVVGSVIHEIDRVGRPPGQMGAGFVFGGSLLLANGTRQGWAGFLPLNGSLSWDTRLSHPALETIVSVQYNTSDQVYFTGHGLTGWGVMETTVEGAVTSMITRGDPGDAVHGAAIIKHDAGFTNNDNGISIVGRKQDGRSFIVTLDPGTGTIMLERIEPAGKVVTCVATDPLLPGIIYIGGQRDGKAFVEQVNVTTGTTTWTRVIDHDTGIINAIQVEPDHGGVIAVGRIANDVLVYPLTWYGSEGWNLLQPPYFRHGGTAMDEATGIVIVGEQTFMMYICGTTTSYSVGGTDMLVVKVSFNARMEWERTWGAMGNEIATTISAEPGYAIYVAGSMDDRAVIVENPTGTIHPAAKWFGSTMNVLVFVVFVIMVVPVVVGVATVQVRKRRARKQLDAWIEDKRQQGGAGG